MALENKSLNDIELLFNNQMYVLAVREGATADKIEMRCGPLSIDPPDMFDATMVVEFDCTGETVESNINTWLSQKQFVGVLNREFQEHFGSFTADPTFFWEVLATYLTANLLFDPLQGFLLI